MGKIDLKDITVNEVQRDSKGYNVDFCYKTPKGPCYTSRDADRQDPVIEAGYQKGKRIAESLFQQWQMAIKQGKVSTFHRIQENRNQQTLCGSSFVVRQQVREFFFQDQDKKRIQFQWVKNKFDQSLVSVQFSLAETSAKTAQTVTIMDPEVLSPIQKELNHFAQKNGESNSVVPGSTVKIHSPEPAICSSSRMDDHEAQP